MLTYWKCHTEVPIYSWNQSHPGFVFVSSEPFLIVRETKVTGDKVWAVWRVGQQLPLERVDSTGDEAVSEGALSCKRRTFFWASLECNFFFFSFFFFFFLVFFFFSKFLWIVSSSLNSTFWHEMSRYYSMWIPKSNQHNRLHGSVRCASDWWSGGCGFNPPHNWQHSYVEIWSRNIFCGHSFPSADSRRAVVILAKKMCTILDNRLEV